MAKQTKDKNLLVRKAAVSSFYRAWVNMKSRCSNKNTPYYKRYGARGIKVCKKWVKFDGFVDDMFDSYEPGLSLDRIDNDKGYYKSNCRWATAKEQANNTRRNRTYTWNNMTKSLAEWAKYIGVNRSTLAQRIYVYKWDIEKCLTYSR